MNGLCTDVWILWSEKFRSQVEMDDRIRKSFAPSLCHMPTSIQTSEGTDAYLLEIFALIIKYSRKWRKMLIQMC